jgi:hypothetical protein
MNVHEHPRTFADIHSPRPGPRPAPSGVEPRAFVGTPQPSSQPQAPCPAKPSQAARANEPGCPARWAESSLVARSLSRQVRAARLTPSARWFQFKVTFSTEGLVPPTPHPWPARALAPIVAAALVARPKATHGPSAWPCRAISQPNPRRPTPPAISARAAWSPPRASRSPPASVKEPTRIGRIGLSTGVPPCR